MGVNSLAVATSIVFNMNTKAAVLPRWVAAGRRGRAAALMNAQSSLPPHTEFIMVQLLQLVTVAHCVTMATTESAGK